MGKLRTLFRYLSLGSVIIVIVVGLAAAIIWFWLRPTGHLILAISNDVEQYKTIISQHFAAAAARTQIFATCQGKLSFTIDSEIVKNPKPGQRMEDAFQFGDIVHLDLKFNLGKEATSFSGEFKLNPIAQKLYEEFGYYDYYLLVLAYEEDQAALSKERTPNQSSGSGKKPAKIIARLYPLDNNENEIPGPHPGSIDILRDRLAFYMFQLFWRYKVPVDNQAHIVPPTELSVSIPSLEHTVNGFEILIQGTTHGVCAGLSEEKCVDEAKLAFDRALYSDPENSFAKFGLGLVFLRKALDAMPNVSAYTVGNLLAYASRNLYAARSQSEYLRNLTDSPDWLKLLKMPGYNELNITNNFIDTFQFYELARNEFAKARYDQTDDLLAKIEDVPRYFSGHLRSLEYETKLYLAKTQNEALQLLTEFEELSQEEASDPFWRQSYAFHACRHNIDIENALNWLDQAINDAPDLVSYFDSYVLKAQCFAMLGRYNDAKAVVEPVLDHLTTSPDIEKFEGVYLDLGYMFAFMKDYETAADYFIKAAKFWREYLDHVRDSVDLKDFRETGHEAFRRFIGTVHEIYSERENTSVP